MPNEGQRRIDPPRHSRTFNLRAGEEVRGLALPFDPEGGQWICHVQNTRDGANGVIQVEATIAGGQSTQSLIECQVGPGSAEQFYFTGTTTVTLRAIAFPATVSIWVEKANAWVSVPPQRFTSIGTTPLAYQPMSLNNGFPPPYKRYFTCYSDVSIDVRIVDENGAVLWDLVNALVTRQPIVGILPPGCRLTAKGNAAIANITTAWHQTR
jgi:hypothetical protein